MSEVAQSQGSEVRAVMKPAELLAPDATVQEVTQAMVELGVDALAVGVDGRVQGIITDRDILIRLVAEGRDAATTLAHHIMSRDVVTCSPDDEIEAVLNGMELHQIRRMPVVDQDGKMIGMVSIDRPASVGRIAPVQAPPAAGRASAAHG